MVRNFLFLPVVAIAASCSSLTSYSEEISPAMQPFGEGRFEVAAEEARTLADDRAESNSAGLFFLEEGSMSRAAALMTGDPSLFEQSIGAFDAAELVFRAGYDNRAQLDPAEVAEQVAGFGLSQKAMAYKGQVQDRVMLHAYKVMNFLALGELDDAASEARRIVRTQEQVEGERQEEMTAFQAESTSKAEKVGFSLDIRSIYASATLEDGSPLRGGLGALYVDTGRQNFDNDFATFLVGLVRRIRNDPGEDPEYDFARVAEAQPGNRAVAEELEAIRAGAPPSGWGWVLFENGLAPRKTEVLVKLPVGYVKQFFTSKPDLGEMLEVHYMSLPSLTPGALAVADGLAFEAGGVQYRTETVAALSSLLAFEFQQDWPMILSRELTAALVKGLVLNGAADLGADALGDQGIEVPSWLSSLGIGAASKALTQADDRAWVSSARRFEVARFPLSGVEQILLHDGAGGQVLVPIPRGAGNVVSQAKMIRPGILHANTRAFGQPTP